MLPCLSSVDLAAGRRGAPFACNEPPSVAGREVKWGPPLPHEAANLATGSAGGGHGKKTARVVAPPAISDMRPGQSRLYFSTSATHCACESVKARWQPSSTAARTGSRYSTPKAWAIEEASSEVLHPSADWDIGCEPQIL